MTPREFYIISDAHKERQKQEYEERVTLAYMTAMWTAQWLTCGVKFKKQPKDLDEILGNKKTKEGMSDDQMFKVVQMITLAKGGEIDGGR